MNFDKQSNQNLAKLDLRDFRAKYIAKQNTYHSKSCFNTFKKLSLGNWNKFLKSSDFSLITTLVTRVTLTQNW